MAYFTRGRMGLLLTEMIEANDRFADGATENREADIRALIECQQKALVLGEYIESMGMDYSFIVAMFSTYCNMIYSIAENLDNREHVINNQIEINNLLWKIMHEIDKNIIEISNIDIYDFSGLVNTKQESVKVSKEINRLIDNCLLCDSQNFESEEFTRELVVGTY